MAGLRVRRLSGMALRLGARTNDVPVIGSGLRLASQPLLGLDRLRDARLGTIAPYRTPDGPDVRGRA